MKAAELEAQFRHDAGDQQKPYLFSQKDVFGFLTKAQEEACKRGDLIREDRDGPMCELPVAAGDFPPDLDSAWTRIDVANYLVPGDVGEDPTVYPLEILSDRKVLDARDPNWRYCSNGTPKTLLIEGDRLRLVPRPDTAGTLMLEGFRLPREPLANASDEPEIPSVHHLMLVQWALKMAFERPDSETRDPGRAKEAEQRFADYFGPTPDSQLLQETESPPVVRCW